MRSLYMRMKVLLVPVALVGLLGASAQPATADEAAAMYSPGAIDAIELTLPKVSEETLEKEPKENYVEGFITLRETAGTPGSEGPPVINAMKVGIRLKGNEGGLPPAQNR